MPIQQLLRQSNRCPYDSYAWLPNIIHNIGLYSTGYMDDQGAYICSGFKRYTLRANVTSDIRKWLQIGLNVSGTHSVQDYPKQDDSTISNVVMFARSLPSFYPVYQRDLATGAYLLDENGNRMFDYGEYRPNSYAKYNLLASM